MHKVMANCGQRQSHCCIHSREMERRGVQRERLESHARECGAGDTPEGRVSGLGTHPEGRRYSKRSVRATYLIFMTNLRHNPMCPFYRL